MLRYAENDDKTDQKMYATGICCTKDSAYEDMLAVQKRFGLQGKEEANLIGTETAKRMWGDEFQMLS